MQTWHSIKRRGLSRGGSRIDRSGRMIYRCESGVYTGCSEMYRVGSEVYRSGIFRSGIYIGRYGIYKSRVGVHSEGIGIHRDCIGINRGGIRRSYRERGRMGMNSNKGTIIRERRGTDNIWINNMQPLVIDTGYTPYPARWNYEYAELIVKLVLFEFSRIYPIRLQWHPVTDEELNNIIRQNIREFILKSERDYNDQFHRMQGKVWNFNESVFDEMIEVIYQEHLAWYYVPLLDYHLATAIALFAIYSTHYGLFDALDHAVGLILQYVRKYKWENISYTTSDLIAKFGECSLDFPVSPVKTLHTSRPRWSCSS